MKPYVWYSKATSVTGRALAKALGLSRGTNKFNRGYGTKIPSAGTTHVISWGARRPTRRVEFRRRNLERRKVLNNPYYSEPFKDKLLALVQMSSTVSVPIFADRYGYNWRLEQMSYPFVGRTKYHYGGSGFKFIENKEQLMADNQSDYWMEYIDGEDKREYRVHVFNGEVVRVQRKKPKEDENGEEVEPTNYKCRSHDNGWRFSLCDVSRIHDSIKSNSISAVESLNLNFGAVDIIRIPSINATYVLEVNTGMGLDNAGLEFYTELFRRWLE